MISKKSILLTGFCTMGLLSAVFAQSDCQTPQKPEVTRVVDRQVSLKWESPETIYGLFDDFEGHADFAINSPGTIGWSYWDMDNAETYGISEYQYDGRGKRMAFQIFNPSHTSPAYTSERGMPHSGNKYLISFATVTEERNDWIISPDLSAQGFTDSVKVAFFARSLSSTYGLEKIKVGYSTTDNTPSSFTFWGDGEEITVPESDIDHPDMYYFEFTFPPQSKYIAINCVTVSGFALLIDDLAIGTNRIMPIKSAHNYLTGYNLYRNGTKVNTGLILRTEYVDTVPEYGNVEYTLEAVYQNCTSERSEVTSVEVPDIHQLPFVENFDSYDLATNFWETSPEESYWSVDYIEGGLVDPAAMFKPRTILKDYSDFCLTTMELDATELEGVMFSYDVALKSYRPETVEYLQAQVYDGTRWVTLKTHTNQSGSFGYTRFYFDISEYVAGKKFRIRFNGGGAHAFNIIAWYVSYVKVYEKAKADVSGTVSLAGSPLEGIPIVFTSEDNDIYRTQSQEDGSYALTNVDAGNYTVSVSLQDYNPYLQETSIVKGTNTIDIAMTRPEVDFTPDSVKQTMKAEDIVSGNVAWTNSGNGEATAKLWVEYDQVPLQQPQMKIRKTFRPSDLMQAAICFDGTYFYLGSNYDTYDGTIWKYDKEGNYLESFVPNIHVRKYYGMAYDGARFYVANGDSVIRVMDFAGKRLMSEIRTKIPAIKHIAYDASKDAFWVGDYSTLALVGKDGATIEEEIRVDASFSGSVYDPYCEAGPSLWIIDQSNPYNPANPADLATVRRFDLNSMTVKEDYVFPCETLPGYIHGQGAVSTWGVGLYGTADYERGKFVLMGTILSDPGLVFVIDFYDLPYWVSLDRREVQMAAGESGQLTYRLDAADMLSGETRNAKIRVRFEPEIAEKEVPVRVEIDGKAQYAKPVGLTVSVEDDQRALLEWQLPQADQTPQRYRIYRNGQKIDSVTGTAYTDSDLKAGTYRYEVSAVYAGGKESKLSNPVEIEIYVGIACYVPQRLTASNVLNRMVSLSWLDPSLTGLDPVSLRWDNGVNADGIGLSGGGTFEGGAAWTPAELADYRDMPIRSVSFFPSGSAEFKLKIYEDRKLVYQQEIPEFTVGMTNTVELDTLMKVNDRMELAVCIESTTGTGSESLVLGIDNGPAKEGKGNLIYSTGFGWTTLTAMGGSDANFNIALNLDPKEEIEVGESTALGYHIYRDSVRINPELVESYRYVDSIDVPGIYTYHVTAVYDNCESYYSNKASAQIVDISDHSAPQNLQAQIEMNRNVDLYWNHPNTDMNGAKNAYQAFDYIRHVDLSATYEQAVGTDGSHIYTAFWNRNGEFNKYDMEGNFIESFTIEGVGPIYDLTYDGQYFYGGGNTTTLYCMDFQTRQLVREITVTSPVRHCTYVPELDNGKGGFEIGEWTTSYFVSKTGAYLDYGVSGLDGASGSAYYDGKLYFFQQGSGGYCQIVEVDFSSLEPTGQQTDLSQWTILDLPDNARAGGLTSYTAPNGTGVLLADIQQTSPRTNTLVYLEAERNLYISGYNLYRDGRKLNEEILPNRTYSDTLSEEGDYVYEVTAVYMDGVESPESNPLTVSIVSPTRCDAPIDLHVSLQQRNAQLNWTVPMDADLTGDDIESYAHLATGTIGAWTTVDRDKANTWTTEELGFSGAGQPSSFIVLDQNDLQPAVNGIAYSGDKFLAAFGAVSAGSDEEIAYSNDYLIIPIADKTVRRHWLTFMARAWKPGKSENFKVAYSLAGTQTENFVWVTSEAESVYHLWTRFVYEIPSEAQYVALNYVSGNGAALLLDNILIDTAEVKTESDDRIHAGETLREAVSGYYVYRDGECLTPEPIKALSYFDGNLPNGTYRYQVKALYNTSCLSDTSSSCRVDVAVDDPCNPPTGLSAEVFEEDVELRWTAPYAAESQTISQMQTSVASAYMSTAEVYYLGVKWEPMDLMGVFGYSIRSVSAMFYSMPNALQLNIYQGGELVYSEDVTDQCVESFSEFVLKEPLAIDYSKDLLVGFMIEAESEAPTMVVDGGPAVPGKGDLYSENGKDWVSNYIYNMMDVNWAIMVNMELLRPQKAPNTLQGYLLYRDGYAVQKAFLQETTYRDTAAGKGMHTYYVTAYYSDCGEAKSNTVAVTVGASNPTEACLSAISVYPNPATEKLYVQGRCTQACLLSAQGQVMQTFTFSSGQNTHEIEVGYLPAGVYILRIQDENGGFHLHKVVIR